MTEATILYDRTKKEKVKNTEILPNWIKNNVEIRESIKDTIKVKKLSTLSVDVTKALQKSYKNLFPIQYTIIPELIKARSLSSNPKNIRPRDVCICAPTGCGKTLTFIIPVLEFIMQNRQTGIQALIVLPVRDLAFQIYLAFKEFTDKLGISVVCINGFTNIRKESKSLLTESNDLAEIVICTPGRLVDHIRNNKDFKLDNLSCLIIDEADRLINEEKQDWYLTLIEHIPNYNDNLIQNMSNCFNKRYLHKILLSATFQFDPLKLEQFNLWMPILYRVQRPQESTENTSKPITTSVPNKKADIHAAPEGLQEYFVTVPDDKVRILFLVHLIRTRRESKGFAQILCFCNRKEIAERLLAVLGQFEDIKLAYLSCDLPHKSRDKLRKSLEEGEIDMLLTVDSMSRGINYENSSNVISNLVVLQYQLPKSAEQYVHRVGRTARRGASGESYALCTMKQVYHLRKDLKSMGHQIKQYKFQQRKIHKYFSEYKAALEALQSTDHVENKMEE